MTDILRFFILRFVDNYYLSIFKGIGRSKKKTVLCLLALTREHRVACQAAMMKEAHFMDRSALFSSHLSLINLLASSLWPFFRFIYVLLIFTRTRSTTRN